MPASLQGIDLTVNVAGQHFEQHFPPDPDQGIQFAWDGLDAFGRPVQGAQTALVSVGYLYPYIYTQTSQFGYNGNGLAISASLGRGEIMLAKKERIQLGPFEAKALGLGGWTLDIHHADELAAHRLQLGDGERLDATSLAAVAELAASRPSETGGTDEIAVGPDRSVYFGFRGGSIIRRTAINGSTTVYAGTPNVGGGHAGDGLLATDPAVRINAWDLTLGRDGAMYLAERATNTVRRIGVNKIVSTVAGTTVLGHSGDGGPASAALVREPNSVAVAPDGTLYIGERASIRRVATDGTISTVAGNNVLTGALTLPPDGTIATSIRMEPRALALAPDGTLYAAILSGTSDTLANRIVRFVDGRTYHVAGNGAGGFTADGLPAKQSSVRVLSMAFDPEGRLYFQDSSSRTSGGTARNSIRTINVADGKLNTVAGSTDLAGPIPPNAPCPTALASVVAVGGPLSVADVAVGPDGVYGGGLCGASVVFHVRPPEPHDTGAPFSIGDRTQPLLFDFDALGRHLRTRHSLTGTTQLTFGYDALGLLTSVADSVNLVAQIQRSPAGTPQAIVGPFGQTTTLELDPNGYLASVTDPEGNQSTMGYSFEGLLTSFTNARGFTSTMSYDPEGLLEVDADVVGGSHTLDRTDSGLQHTVTRTTALGRTTTYDVDPASQGGSYVKTVTDPAGLQSTLTIRPSRDTYSALPDGTLVTSGEVADARFGLNGAPIPSRSTALPSGLTSTQTTTRTYALLNPSNPLDFDSMTEDSTINGRLWRTIYRPSTRTYTMTSPVGRTSTRIIDTLGRTTRTQVTGLERMDYQYDTSGRLLRTNPGNRRPRPHDRLRLRPDRRLRRLPREHH